MNYAIDADALERLRRAGKPTEWLASMAPSQWVTSAFGTEYFGPCLSVVEKLSRRSLADFISVQAAPMDRLAAVASWGGMKIIHGRRVWQERATWTAALERLDTVPTRMAAYDLFAGLRRESALKGVGPAYFTKLIFFLRPELNGYILDQWLARSVNLLYPCARIRMSYAKTVADSNTPEDYERYCSLVEDAARRIGLEPREAEERLFSIGGKDGAAGEWRLYVRART